MDHTLSFVEATRLILTEDGELDDDDFDELLESVETELRGDPGEELGYVFARWGYWWVMKVM